MTPKGAMMLIAAGVLAWGIFLGIGAYLFNHNIMRFVMVMGCVGGFLAFWGVMLYARSVRLKRQKPRRLGSRDAC